MLLELLNGPLVQQAWIAAMMLAQTQTGIPKPGDHTEYVQITKSDKYKK